MLQNDLVTHDYIYFSFFEEMKNNGLPLSSCKSGKEYNNYLEYTFQFEIKNPLLDVEKTIKLILSKPVFQFGIELIYVKQNEVRVEITKNGYKSTTQRIEELKQITKEKINTTDNLNKNVDLDSMDGKRFESFLLDTLRAKDIRAEITKSSGDQGVDLIVRYRLKTIVIQYKRYSNTVGNSAIQEVYAGDTYYNADAAIVITNNKFTSSAIELAERCRVLLIDKTSIKDFLYNPQNFFDRAIWVTTK